MSYLPSAFSASLSSFWSWLPSSPCQSAFEANSYRPFKETLSCANQTDRISLQNSRYTYPYIHEHVLLGDFRQNIVGVQHKCIEPASAIVSAPNLQLLVRLMVEHEAERRVLIDELGYSFHKLGFVIEELEAKSLRAGHVFELELLLDVGLQLVDAGFQELLNQNHEAM